MSEKPEGTLLEGVARKIGSTLGVVVAEASKVVRPLRTKTGVQAAKSTARRTRRKSSSASSAHPVRRKRKRAVRRSK